MRVFLSWSGETSRELAEVFRTWLPSVIQAVKPYFSPSDIEKGTKWNSEISKSLDESDFGIIFLTKSNTEKPWLLFESGALSKSFERANVCPIMFGIESTDVSGPLSHFQLTNFNKREIRQLVDLINQRCSDLKLGDLR